MIKAIVFDFAGVISNHPLRHWLEKHMPDDKKLEEEYHRITNKWDLGEINYNESLNLISKITAIPREEVYDEIFKPVVFKKEIVNLINSLKRHYKIVIFSNNQKDFLIQMISDKGHSKLFDEIIVSSDHKITKPNPKFYQKMLAIIGAKADEVIFVDDKKENVDAGNSLKITSFLFTNLERLKKDLKSKGVNV